MTNYRGLMAENTGCVVNCLVFLMTHLFMMTFLLMHDIVVQGALNIQVARRK